MKVASRMVVRIAVACLIPAVFTVIGGASGDLDGAAIAAKLERAKANFYKDIEKFQADVLKQLDVLDERAVKAGNKKLVDQIAEEREAFEADHNEFPKVLGQREIQRRMDRIRGSMDKAYAVATAEYTKVRMRTKANEVENELEAFRDPGLIGLDGRQWGNWAKLLNGKNLDGWKSVMDGNWEVLPDGTLRGTRGWGLLMTTRTDYKDFKLRLKARISSGGRSGVFFRTQAPEIPKTPASYQSHIHGTPEKARQSGSIAAYDGSTDWASLARATADSMQPGEWFSMEILAIDRRFTVRIGGRTVAQTSDPGRYLVKGAICLLQPNNPTGSVVEFKDIEVSELN